MATLSSRFAKAERKLTSVVRAQRKQGEKIAHLSTRMSRLDSARKALGLPRGNPTRAEIAENDMIRAEDPTLFRFTELANNLTYRTTHRPEFQPLGEQRTHEMARDAHMKAAELYRAGGYKIGALRHMKQAARHATAFEMSRRPRGNPRVATKAIRPMSGRAKRLFSGIVISFVKRGRQQMDHAYLAKPDYRYLTGIIGRKLSAEERRYFAAEWKRFRGMSQQELNVALKKNDKVVSARQRELYRRGQSAKTKAAGVHRYSFYV